MTVQREQVRRDADDRDTIARCLQQGGELNWKESARSLLAGLEQAERDKKTLSEANRALQRSAIANRDGRKIAEARLASVPALVEDMRITAQDIQGISLNGTDLAKTYHERGRAIDARITDFLIRLTVYEQSQGGKE